MKIEIEVPSQRCIACDEEKPLDQFKQKTSGYGLRPQCRTCELDTRRQTKLKAQYGIDGEEFNMLWEDQEGRCAICEDPFESRRNTHVDHCHILGYVRGLLCFRCNVGLGSFQDNPQRLLKAVRYLGSIDRIEV